MGAPPALVVVVADPPDPPDPPDPLGARTDPPDPPDPVGTIGDLLEPPDPESATVEGAPAAPRPTSVPAEKSPPPQAVKSQKTLKIENLWLLMPRVYGGFSQKSLGICGVVWDPGLCQPRFFLTY